ncbi:MAG: hypothetical protein QME78_06960, partial [Thermodesulfobacteriota bacterium]|nr:hypothetical protein [Thermodesulfobacteriota bacterium]
SAGMTEKGIFRLFTSSSNMGWREKILIGFYAASGILRVVIARLSTSKESWKGKKFVQMA